MTRRAPCAFRKTDIRRAVEAAESTGKSVAGVEIRRDGSVFVRYGEPLAGTEKGGDDDLQSIIDEYKADGQARHPN